MEQERRIRFGSGISSSAGLALVSVEVDHARRQDEVLGLEAALLAAVRGGASRPTRP
jgi:hypothetical protein